MTRTDLSSFSNPDYRPGKSLIVRMVWYFTSLMIFQSGIFPIYRLKATLLRLFGAKVGTGVVIKPGVHIKYPWKLRIGDHCWIGEKAWIDNLANVDIGNNVCISQGAMLLTGNHNYKKTTFDLMTESIILEEGVWIGAQSVVCPGVMCRSHSILTVGSTATEDLEEYGIYQGNPAILVRKRIIG